MRTFSLGAGADVVKFTSASSADANTITNFTVANDKLSFDKTAFTGYASGSISAFEDAYDNSGSSYKTATKGNAYFIDGVTHTLENAKTEFKNGSAAAGITIVVDQSNGNIYAFNFNSTSAAATSFDLVGTVGSAGATLTVSNLEVF